MGSFASPRFGIAIAAWELFLGFWLIAGFNAFAWLAAVITFSSFAIVSGYFGVIGVSNCGCFGAVKASPWTAFAVDIAALISLVLARPKRIEWNVLLLSPRRLLLPVTIASVMIGMGCSIAMLEFGSLGRAVAILRGERIGLSASYVDVGEGAVGNRLSGKIDVTNFSEVPLRIVGGTTDCSCTMTDNLPLTLQPGETAAVTIQMKVPQTPSGQMTRKVWLLTDSPEAPKLFFRIGCRVN